MLEVTLISYFLVEIHVLLYDTLCYKIPKTCNLETKSAFFFNSNIFKVKLNHLQNWRKSLFFPISKHCVQQLHCILKVGGRYKKNSIISTRRDKVISQLYSWKSVVTFCNPIFKSEHNKSIIRELCLDGKKIDNYDYIHIIFIDDNVLTQQKCPLIKIWRDREKSTLGKKLLLRYILTLFRDFI